jgi:hypothetical protein
MPLSVTLQCLLSGGYLPEILPPCFDSQTFGAAFAAGTNPPKEFDSANRQVVPLSSKCVTYHQTVVGGRSRIFSIPNPVHYYRLAHCVAENWTTIESHARASVLSLTKPVIRAGVRCIQPEVDFDARPSHRARLRSTSRVIFKADIARFFPSIYTHSISWAFHGKEVAKSRKGDRTLLGNQLDSRFQSLQDRQTMGIPVGQDISRVIAEVILARVENEMDISSKIAGIRSIDDYEVGFMNEGAAATFQHALERSLSNFELALNPLKTAILPLPQLLLDAWDSELRAFDFGAGFVPTPQEPQPHDPLGLGSGFPDFFQDVAKTDRLLLFFNKAISLQQQFPYDGVLRFSLLRLAQLRITEDCWPLYQDYLLHCALNQPETLRVAASNLLKAEFFDRHSVDRKRLKIVVEALVISAAPLGQSSSVAWALWIALIFELKLSARATAELSRARDSAIGCLAFEMRSRGLLAKKFDTNELLALIGGKSGLYEDHWLLAYEVARNGWASAKRTSIKDPCFAYLNRSGVSFCSGKAVDKLKKELEDAASEDSSSGESTRMRESYDDVDFDTWWLR